MLDTPIEDEFVTPPWEAPLDVDAVLAGIPAGASISGMFLSPLVEAAQRLGRTLPSARERYTRFRFYPLCEHVRLLLETCEQVYPDRSPRQALRKLGRGAPNALLDSTLGKVVLGSAAGPEQALHALAKAYALNLRPGSASVLEVGDAYAKVELREVFFFLDSHHVGTFEGLLRHVGHRAKVRVRSIAQGYVQFLITW